MGKRPVSDIETAAANFGSRSAVGDLRPSQRYRNIPKADQPWSAIAAEIEMSVETTVETEVVKPLDVCTGRRRIVGAMTAVTALAGWAIPLRVRAQPDYPSKTIHFICPFSAGGAADAVARLIAAQLAQRLGGQVVVENRTGANGNIGTQQVAQAEPDGHTLLLGFDGTLVINPHIYSKLPFDPVKDFAPVGKIGDVPLLVLANPKVPAKTLAELIAHSKTVTGGLGYGTAGTGSTQHIMFELLKQRVGAHFTHVPYKGAAPAMVDVIGGHIPLVGAALAGSLDYIRTGRLRAIAISTAQRSRYLPDVPTLIESGVPDLTITAWHSVMAPARTPKATIDRLSAALKAALSDPAVVERLDSVGSIAAPGSPENLAEQILRDLERYGRVVKAAGLRVE
jgi:tripartite-type tricarboxylate transporter receptor subunit TctC